MPPQSESTSPSHLVAIGASAGGLEAIEQLFEKLPVDSGMAFVVVQHLSPDFKSLMGEILIRHTSMPVHKVEEGMQMKANEIYLIPAAKQMIITKDGFHLTDRSTAVKPEQTISVFFHSVAEVWGDKSIGIVLSGSGSDGSNGLAEISEVGGLSMVQDPEEAKFDAMPRSALIRGRVDIVRSARKLVEPLILFAKNPKAAKELDIIESVEVAEDDLLRILQLLDQSYGTDFTQYKPGTVNRRIERRTSIQHRMNLSDYREMLEEDAEELDALYKDLLIGVTQFFRDTESFEKLEKEGIPQLFEELSPVEELRVWVPGCASGEEVYSIAILLEEYRSQSGIKNRWKIFATDIHTGSLDRASTGEYTSSQIAKVSTERLGRFFSKVGENYRVNRVLRDDVVFATHNVLRDPPFTRLHLISCRNMLIYFGQEAQEEVLNVFSFALRLRGLLFLGSSESLGSAGEELDVLDQPCRIFQKNRNSRIGSRMGRSGITKVKPTRPEPRSAERREIAGEPTLTTMESLLATQIESGVMIDSRGELVYSIGETRNFLSPPSGRMMNQFVEMLPEELRMSVSGAIHQVRSKKEKVEFLSEIEEQEERQLVSIKITLVPSKTSADELIFVSLSKIQRKEIEKGARIEGEDSAGLEIDGFAAQRIEELEADLKRAQEGMQNVVEELETSNEELQSTNEELVAANEELQSTNEELQSVNEELYTVNAEFDSKNRELSELNNDLDNLLKSTGIGVVFLDRELNIRRFTPAAASAIHLLESDVGRPLGHITNSLRIRPDDLFSQAQEVAVGGRVIEEEVQNQKGDWLLMRILPFLSSDTETDGVVIAFVDIDQIKVAQEARAEESQRQAVMMESVDTTVWLHLSAEGKCLESQPAWKRFTGQDWPRYEGSEWTASIHDEDRRSIERQIQEKISEGVAFELKPFKLWRDDSKEFRICDSSFWPVKPDGEITGWVVCLSDEHETELAQAEIAHQKSILDAIINNSDTAISVKDLDKRFILLNGHMAGLLGVAEPDEMVGKTVEEAGNPEIAKLMDQYDEHVIQTGRNRNFESQLDASSPETPYRILKFPLRAPDGTVEGVVGIATNLSSRERQINSGGNEAG